MESFLQKNLFQIMNIWFWVQTWVDVDFLAVGKLTKTTFPMAYEAKKGRLTFSFYVIKRFTQIFVKVIKKMKNERVLESYIIFFTTSYHLRPDLLFSESNPTFLYEGCFEFCYHRCNRYSVLLKPFRKLNSGGEQVSKTLLCLIIDS